MEDGPPFPREEYIVWRSPLSIAVSFPRQDTFSALFMPCTFPQEAAKERCAVQDYSSVQQGYVYRFFADGFPIKEYARPDKKSGRNSLNISRVSILYPSQG
jgi:hypothetical protein